MNYAKTVAVHLGDSDTRYLEARGIRWQVKGRFTILGIMFDLDNPGDLTGSCFHSAIRSFETTLNAWTSRNLTVFGRITVIKSLALSQLVHLFTSLPSPPRRNPKPDTKEVLRVHLGREAR